MRYLKKLLTSIYLYIGVLFALCFVAWCITGEEPSSLIMGISAAAGVESLASGAIRIFENKQNNDFEKEREHGKQNQLGTETDQP